MQKLLFENAYLRTPSVKGVLKKNGDDSYTVPLGALGIKNVKSDFYLKDEKSIKTFSIDGVVNAKCKEGLLFGEWGHPKFSDYGSISAYERRLRTYDERNICMSIIKVWLEDLSIDGKKTTYILGKIIPFGPMKDNLLLALQDSRLNFCFSGRYISDFDVRGNIAYRSITNVLGWDAVSGSGIPNCNKYNSPTLESEGEFEYTNSIIDEARKHERQLSSISTESSFSTSIDEIASLMKNRRHTNHSSIPSMMF